MRIMNRAAALLTAALLLSVGLSGCSASEKIIDYTDTAATLAPGEVLVIDFGEVNASVGSEWVMVEEPDAAVLGEGEEHSDYLGESGETGAASDLSYRFAAVGEGTTTIEFEYRFRGFVPEDPEDQKTATIEVTVE
jgi:predicted secreted protein